MEKRKCKGAAFAATAEDGGRTEDGAAGAGGRGGRRGIFLCENCCPLYSHGLRIVLIQVAFFFLSLRSTAPEVADGVLDHDRPAVPSGGGRGGKTEKKGQNRSFAILMLYCFCHRGKRRRK